MSASQPALAEAPAPAMEEWVESALRHELKYVGPAGQAEPMRALLLSLCPPDPGFPENTVHSVYFDTRRLASYEDKANGQYWKEKLRLRWYEPSAGAAWLEWKTRHGSLGGKRRKRVAFTPPADPAAVRDEDFAAVVREHLGLVLPPVLWLQYRRLRRIAPDGSARVALDREIRVRWSSRALPVRRPPRDLPFFVVEVKGDHPEPSPWLSRAIGRYAAKTAFSKYALCVDHVRGGCA